MPDTTFETFLTSQLRAYADAGIRPIDCFAIVEDAITGGRTTPGWRLGWGLTPMRRNRVLSPLLVGLLLGALAGGALLVGSRLVAPTKPPDTGVSMFVRRVTDPTPGVAVLAVDADGAERLIRHVSDSLVDGMLAEWGTVSDTGWLALAVQNNGWPMVLVDLRDEGSAPWVVTEANTGGIGPRWGPTGLIAADAGGNGSRLVVADPEKHTARIISSHGGLIGGGPSIVWAGDGSGIVTSGGPTGDQVVPIDGSDPQPGVGDVFDPRGAYGSSLAELRICSPGAGCRGAADGRVERVELDASATTIWQQDGADRALAASFGSRADEYWLSVDHNKGRQVALVHLHDGRQDTVATVNRDARWQSVGAPTEAPDGSALIVWIDIGAKPAAVLVPLHGDQPTFHTGNFAGFVDGAAAAAFATGQPGMPAQTMSAEGQAYALPPLDELISAELERNPGRKVLGQASRDAVDGEIDRRTFVVARDKPGGAAQIECFGPSSVTVTSGSESITNPCLRAGAYEFTMGASGPITVSATGDTAWRVVVYSP